MQQSTNAEVMSLSEISTSYPITNAAIAELSKRFAPLEITNTKTYKTVTTAIGEVRGYRMSVEKKRKELKKDALEYGRKVDGEAKRITALLKPIEDELKAKKQVVDDQKKLEKAEKARIEAERVDGIRGKIADIQRLAMGLSGLTVENLMSLGPELDAAEPIPEEYAELTLEAKQAHGDVKVAILKALEDRMKFEEEEEARLAESERLEKVRLEQEAEAKRLAKAQAKIDAQNRKIEQERERLEDEKQAEIDRKDREALEKKLAAEAKIQAEKDAAEKAEWEEAERAAKEKAEAAEKAKSERLKPDKAKLQDFANELLNIEPVKVKSKGAKILAGKVQGQILTVAQNLIVEIKEL